MTVHDEMEKCLSGHDFKVPPTSFMEELKTHEVYQNSQSLVWDLNLEPPEHKAEVVTTALQYSVNGMQTYVSSVHMEQEYQTWTKFVGGNKMKSHSPASLYREFMSYIWWKRS
jgi:hypothetical protein